MGLRKHDAAALLILAAVALAFFWPVTLGRKTLLPADNLFAFEPWHTFAAQWNATVPQNDLLSDLILENYAWKSLIRQGLQTGELPLWNPYLFAGIPFLAAGQQSALYPFSALFYLLPLESAYGWFSALQMLLAGAFMYLLGRVLGLNRTGGLIAAITYMASGFFVVSVVFSMVIAAAAWLPLQLACVELVVRRNEERLCGPARSPLPWIVVGALALGVQFLAGHVEISIYSLMVAGAFALWRLVRMGLRHRRLAALAGTAGQLLALAGLGVGLGALQWLPLYELVTQSFRQSSASYQDIISWAYPTRQIITFLIPDAFGNPSQHGYWDVVLRQWVPLVRNALGEPVQSTFWGIKNYVEAGSYVGIIPLMFALAGLWGGRRRRSYGFFIVLAGVSLLFVFGTPLYAVLYYLVPGFKQLHSPFRWVYPYTLCISLLAGWGASALAGTARRMTSDEALGPRSVWLRRLAWLAFGGGLAGAALLAASLWAPGPFVQLGERILAGSDLARAAFPSGQALFSYEWRNLLIFCIALAAGGALLRLSFCPIYLPRRLGGYAVWKPLAIGAVALELFVLGSGFNPAVEPALLAFRPPVVDFLQNQQAAEEPARFITFNAPGEKTFNANVGMFYGLEDVRGYDSIITRQYVDFMEAIAPQANELLYNRIAPIYTDQPNALSSRLLDLLTVRYVLTTHAIPNPGFRLVYDAEVRVYENLDVLPRAFVVAQEEVLERSALIDRLPALEPAQVVLLESLAPEDASALSAGRTGTAFAPAQIVRRSLNTVEVRVQSDGAGWLVLADSFFPGWKAYVRPAQAGEDVERERTIYRADGNFRAVRVDAGDQIVRFVYSPMSFKLALFVAFLAGVICFLLLIYYAWHKMYREEDGEGTSIKRVAKNSLTPMLLSLVNKGIDFAFAMLRLRILGPVNEGSYAFAVVFIGYFEILALFGLGTLLTREVSKDRTQAPRFLGNTITLRAGLWLASLPLMTLVGYLYYRWGSLTTQTAATIGLFALAIFFSLINDALSATFYAHERMEYPAGISAVTNVLKVSFGALVLLMGTGFVGLAGVSVLVNLITSVILFVLVRRNFFRPRLVSEPAFQRGMLATSYPLMINHLLATIFFRIDMLLLKPMQGDVVVGYYSAAYKYIDGLNIIPAYFTLAIFPLMSRFARSARDSLLRAYILSLRLLLMISLPIAAGTPFIARELILLLGGGKFLPDSMIALQLLIFFLPFSYINSVTQYVLIAIDQQRFLTRAFIIGVAFNLVANLIFIPRYGYQAAAVITVLSEWALLIPFSYCVRKHLGPVPWLRILWQPAVSAGLMAGLLWLSRPFSLWLRLPAAVAVYMVSLVALGTFRSEEMAVLRGVLPKGRLGRLLGRLLAPLPENPL